MLVGALLFVFGFFMGRAWFGFWLLSLVYGLPRTVLSVLNGILRTSATLVYLVPVLIWSALFGFIWLGLVLIGINVTVFSSVAFRSGILFDVLAGVSQALSRRGRIDLSNDFKEAMIPYLRTSNRA